MKRIIVYHGSTQTVEHPLCKIGRRNLDFGQGFYVTDIRRQAADGAMNMARRHKAKPILNRYILDREDYLSHSQFLSFKAYDVEWLEFIVANRQGQAISESYDYIEGGVANDRIIDTVNLYMAGLIPQETALARLAEYQPNNQICLRNQAFTDKFLLFDGTEEL